MPSTIASLNQKAKNAVKAHRLSQRHEPVLEEYAIKLLQARRGNKHMPSGSDITKARKEIRELTDGNVMAAIIVSRRTHDDLASASGISRRRISFLMAGLATLSLDERVDLMAAIESLDFNTAIFRVLRNFLNLDTDLASFEATELERDLTFIETIAKEATIASLEALKSSKMYEVYKGLYFPDF